ncbi:MAG: hypothetical protein LBM64_03060 [Deltaproteobacteria bacterium]|jgi:hypothetical protein|nr:hypothetical protein [Deltaproteobacteria bacterium]
MYINLILGVLVLAAIVWLIAGRRRKIGPADMLQDEIARRRAVQETGRKALDNFAALRSARLAGVAEGLESMRRALAASGLRADHLVWRQLDDRIELELGGELLVIRWDIRNLDLAQFAAADSAAALPLGAKAEYSLAWPDRLRLTERDLSEFMRAVSSVIADKLA